jgi:D-sedoheptulose 7-phosphate isomerase
MSVTLPSLQSRLEGLLRIRLDAGGRFFEDEAGRIAEVCDELAHCFHGGGRLLAVGGLEQAWSDAHHVAVEFVHPVIVGKRALPALALDPAHAERLRGPEDAVISFDPLVIETGSASWRFDPPTSDPFVSQELCETLYHLVWELVHIFLDNIDGSSAGAGDSSFLYPFLTPGGGTAPEHLVEDVRRSVLAKAEEVAQLRTQTLTENAEALVAAAGTLSRGFARGATLLAFGNGGSATDAADLVADFRAVVHSRVGERAIDLTGDGAILTALANDVGPEVVFARQIGAYGRPGDVAVALSTSGGSRNVVAALAEARRLGLATIAFVGYDGGRILAERLADHVVVTRSDHVPRIQEAQASAYHVLRELVAAGPGTD